jgi:hypothetical protein
MIFMPSDSFKTAENLSAAQFSAKFTYAAVKHLENY